MVSKYTFSYIRILLLLEYHNWQGRTWWLQKKTTAIFDKLTSSTIPYWPCLNCNFTWFWLEILSQLHGWVTKVFLKSLRYCNASNLIFMVQKLATVLLEISCFISKNNTREMLQWYTYLINHIRYVYYIHSNCFVVENKAEFKRIFIVHTFLCPGKMD